MAAEKPLLRENVRRSTKLLEIFPEEVWREILIHLTEVTDYFNVCQLDSVLQTCFLPLRTRNLFHAVFNVLALYFKKSPTDLQQLALYSRQTCRTWKLEVDKFLQKSDNFFNFIIFPFRGLSFNCHKLCSEYFNSQEQVLAFSEHFEDTHLKSDENPFLGRAVSISQSGDPNDFLQHLIELFRKCGHHIWHLRFTCKYNQSGLPLLLRLLQLLPNLKVLDLIAYTDYPENEQDLMEQHLILNPPPKFENLECMKLEENPLSKFLIAKNTHVPNLHLGRWSANKLVPVLQIPMLSVSSLFIEGRFGGDNVYRALLECKVSLPLKSLRIARANSGLPWCYVFKCLESFCGKTVTKLDVDLPYGTYRESPFTINFPLLESLKLDAIEIFTLDFLEGIRDTLGHLFIQANHMCIIRADLDKPMQWEERVGYKSFPRHLLEYKIWEKLPKLRTISYTWTSDMLEKEVKHLHRFN